MVEVCRYRLIRLCGVLKLITGKGRYRWWTLLQSFLTNLLKSAKISKLLASLAVGMNGNPLQLLNKSFSGVDNTYPKRLRMKFSAQLTPFFITHVYSEWLIYCFLAMHLCDLVFLFPESIVQVLLRCHVLYHSLCRNPIGMGHILQHFEDCRLYLLWYVGGLIGIIILTMCFLSACWAELSLLFWPLFLWLRSCCSVDLILIFSKF